jgi:hypothetical protein
MIPLSKPLGGTEVLATARAPLLERVLGLALGRLAGAAELAPAPGGPEFERELSLSRSAPPPCCSRARMA